MSLTPSALRHDVGAALHYHGAAQTEPLADGSEKISAVESDTAVSSHAIMVGRGPANDRPDPKNTAKSLE
ncbi:MAG: hypothetical protein U1E17_12285 [Geminicoccaceae bacterium]